MRTPGCENLTVRALWIQHYVTIVDSGQCLLDLLLVGSHMLTKIVQVANAGVCDVEGSIRDARVLERLGQQIEQLRADLYRMLRGSALTFDTSLVGL